ncbi:OsmC family protein [Microbacterium sp. p3-SID336]|uniref:OsmC family protein n=1 Tax=Microbacterium sp. p3-SID336 TaxID=2916212 RepID=UPI0021A59903|nr:OsmC family protein [Microbacterium sp. p3-SID336]MCT1479111.1 OsmC family protein [Microbacterium sp. p3-SID336]
MTVHQYRTALSWEGSTGAGYRAYGREHDVQVSEEILTLSADAAFRGDASLPNPEQLLLAAASSCLLLSFLAVAARAGIDVARYDDEATAFMPMGEQPARITRVELTPRIAVRGGDVAHVVELLHEAHAGCYIANSLTAEAIIAPTVEVLS